MKKWMLSLGYFVLLWATLTAQTVNTVIFHNQCELEGKDIVALKDGGAMIVGRADDCYTPTQVSEIDQKRDQLISQDMGRGAFMARLDAKGKLLWLQNLRGIAANYIKKGPDGNFVVAGFIASYREEKYEGDRTQGIWLGKYDPDGKQIWWRILEADYNSTSDGVWICKNGDILVIGDHEYPAKGFDRPKTGRLVRLSPEGKTLYEREIRSFGNFYPYEVRETANEKIMVVGTQPSGSHRNKMSLYQLDHLGKHQWWQSYQWKYSEFSEEDNWGYSLDEVSDGGFIMAGVAHYNDNAYRLVRLDKQGNVLWTKVFPGDIFELPRVRETRDGNFLLVGIADLHPQTLKLHPDPYGEGQEPYTSSVFVMCTDPQGNLLWQRIYHTGHLPDNQGPDLDDQGNIYLTGKYRITYDEFLGEHAIKRNHAKGFYFLKLDPEGKIK